MKLRTILLAVAAAACSAPDVARDGAPSVQCSSLTGYSETAPYGFQQISFRTGRLRIGALLTRPRGSGPFPAYIHNHGAMTRERASGPLWSFPERIDLDLVRAGYVVLGPARRGYLGSEGWTTTYWVTGSSLRAGDVINGAYEEAADVIAAFRYLSECPFVDSKRIAIGGHSVGGLVTIIAGAQLQNVGAIVSINGGITWTEGGVQTGYPAVTTVWHREGRRIRTPVLLLHGKDDTVVIPDLSRELGEVLRRQGTPVELKLYTGGHHYFPTVELIEFLDKYLK